MLAKSVPVPSLMKAIKFALRLVLAILIEKGCVTEKNYPCNVGLWSL